MGLPWLCPHPRPWHHPTPARQAVISLSLPITPQTFSCSGPCLARLQSVAHPKQAPRALLLAGLLCLRCLHRRRLADLLATRSALAPLPAHNNNRTATTVLSAVLMHLETMPAPCPSNVSVSLPTQQLCVRPPTMCAYCAAPCLLVPGASVAAVARDAVLRPLPASTQ